MSRAKSKKGERRTNWRLFFGLRLSNAVRLYNVLRVKTIVVICCPQASVGESFSNDRLFSCHDVQRRYDLNNVPTPNAIATDTAVSDVVDAVSRHSGIKNPDSITTMGNVLTDVDFNTNGMVELLHRHTDD